MRQLKISKQITRRESPALERYLQDISRMQMIAPEDEVRLAKLVKAGDHEALEKLTKANLRFVVSVAKQYQNQGLSLSDLINEGNIGLIKAAQRFDETKGFKFISYAVWWIRQSILQALAENARLVRLPLNKVGELNKMNKILAQLEQEYEREPSAEEIGEMLEMSSEEVADLIKSGSRHMSVDAPVSEGEDTTILDLMKDDGERDPRNNLMYESLKKEIQNVLKILSERDAKVINYYFGLEDGKPLTLEEISQKIGLTRERVRQLKEKGIKRLRKTNRSRILRAYLG